MQDARQGSRYTVSSSQRLTEDGLNGRNTRKGILIKSGNAALYLHAIIMTTTNIKEAVENCRKFANENNFNRGWFGGDGADFWLKFADFEPAQNSRLKYIFFIDGKNITAYQA